MEKINYIVYCWSEYIRSNRIVGIFLLALAFAIVFFAANFIRNNDESFVGTKKLISTECFSNSLVVLFLYCILAAALLIIPFTALALTQFQTVFYQYSTLWLIALTIPVTAIVLTLLTVALFKNLKKSVAVISVLLISIVLFLCGNMGKSTDKLQEFEVIKYSVSYDSSIALLEKLEMLASSEEYNGSVTILAPANITAYAHMYSGNIKTLYGKDIWDDTMKPYTYNEYPEEYRNLYTWMNCVEVFGTFYAVSDQDPKYSHDIDFYEFEKLIEQNEALGGITYFKLAADSGVDIIVIYANTELLEQAQIDYFVTALGLRQEYVSINDTEGYILLFLNVS